MIDGGRRKPSRFISKNDPPFPPAFQSLILVMKILGFEIQTTTKFRISFTSVIFKIYQIMIVLFYVVFTILTFNEICRVALALLKSTKHEIVWLFYCDSANILTTIIHHVINGPRIRSFFNALALLTQSLDDAHGSMFRRTRRWTTIFTTHCALTFVYGIAVMIPAAWHSEDWMRNIIQTRYLGIVFYISDVVGVKLTYYTLETLLIVGNVCACAYSWLIILIIHNLSQCFIQLNNDLRSRKSDVKCQEIFTIQKKHQMIVDLVHEFNVTFSPVVLMYVALSTIQAITGYDQIKKAYEKITDENDPCWDSSWFMIITTMSFLITITFTGGKLMVEVRKQFHPNVHSNQGKPVSDKLNTGNHHHHQQSF